MLTPIIGVIIGRSDNGRHREAVPMQRLEVGDGGLACWAGEEPVHALERYFERPRLAGIHALRFFLECGELGLGDCSQLRWVLRPFS
jgi:hypothetical protein